MVGVIENTERFSFFFFFLRRSWRERGQFRNAKREGTRKKREEIRRKTVESKTYYPGICQEDSSLLQGRSYLDLNGSVERP